MTARRAPLYFDYASSTPPAPEVVAAMAACLRDDGAGANAAAAHELGRRAAARIETARRQLADLLNVPPQRFHFTSGATESVNLAITGAARFRAHRGRHLVTMSSEHKSAVESFRALEAQGFEVSWLAPGPDGVLDLATLASALRDDTTLVSIMHVNNETGTVQDIDAIGALCRNADILFHCDAAQSAGKLPLDLDALPVDLLSLTGHKFYGPQGIGALYVADRPGCGVAPLLHGGGQERGLRPGTLAVHQVVGLGVAAQLARTRLGADLEHLRVLCGALWDGIRDLPGIHRNGAAAHGFPGVLNVSAAGVHGDSLMLALEPLCVARGSACNSMHAEPSFVLRALGLSDDLAQSAIRFSFGRDTRMADIVTARDAYRAAVQHLRRIAPAGAA